MRSALLISAAAVAALLAGAPALAQAPEEQPRAAHETSAYGAFLAGRAAYNAGESRVASAYFGLAREAAPDEILVRDRALSAALLAGDVDTVAALAPTGPNTPPSLREIGRLARAVEALRDGEARAAHAEWRERPLTGLHARAGAFLAPWLAAAAGDWRAALAEPAEDADPLTRGFVNYHRALLLERRRRPDDAQALYQALVADSTLAPLFRLPYGEFLERRGRRAEAVALYDAALAEAEVPALRAARERAARGGRPPQALGLTSGAAQALNSAAQAAMAERLTEFGIVYLRFSLALEPGHGGSLMLLGEALEQAGLEPAAREAWASVPAGSPDAAQAGVMLAWSLQEAGREAEALAAAEAAVRAGPGDQDAAFALASLLNVQGRHPEALEVLSGPALAGMNQDWRVRFVRGAAYEQAGDLTAAQAELQAALSLQPESPEVLNYLGYLLIDQGQRVEEGLAMVEQAVAQEPETGAYQDSLGWGRYRQGRFEEAVTVLERAIALEPADPVINDHLGDAYWRVGRRREAAFQWRRVLTLDPDAGLRAAVEAKLAGGLPGGPLTAADNGAATP